MQKINQSTEARHIPVWFRNGKVILDPDSPLRRVLLVGNGSLFDNGIFDLLKYRPNLTITHTRHQDDISTVKEVIRYRPDVVVLVVSRFMNSEYIVDRLMLVNTFKLRLIVLSLDSIEIEIYERGDSQDEIKSTSIPIRNMDDFLLSISKSLEDAATFHYQPGTSAGREH